MPQTHRILTRLDLGRTVGGECIYSTDMPYFAPALGLLLESS